MRYESSYHAEYLGVIYDQNKLEHYGIKGQKWYVRRFQNEDGSYTAAGKERYGISSGKSGNANTTSRKSSRFISSLTSNSKALTSADKKLIDKVKNGELLSDKEREKLKKSSTHYYDSNFAIGNDCEKIYKKYDAWSHHNELPEDAKRELDKIADKMAENRKASNELEYAKAIDIENKYAESIKDDLKSSENLKYVDPAYRSFNSKQEKAKAEAEYLNNIWYSDDSVGDTTRLNREIGHIHSKVVNLSMDGYEGVPKSERQKALFEYGARSDWDRFNEFDRYDNYIPKYEKSKEWIDLQNQRQKIKDECGYDSTFNAWKNQPSKNIFDKTKKNKLFEAYQKAQQEYSQRTKDIRSQESKIRREFQQQICKNVLLDIGYEVTPENIELIEGLCYYD